MQSALDVLEGVQNEGVHGLCVGGQTDSRRRREEHSEVRCSAFS